jgi:serine/threonine protein kinase
VTLGLITLEYRVRLDRGEFVRLAEYLERFPAYRDILPANLGPHMVGPPEVPGYEILGELGRGGMAVIYKARHIRLGRLVALKMILAGTHAGSSEHERLRTEAGAIARLNHPNVVQVYEAGECDGLPFIALELCDNSLDCLLKAGPLPPQEAARLVEQVAAGVHAAHSAKVVHRDLKPANVLLSSEGTPKVTDFGLAKCLDGSLRSGTGGLIGTPNYMAPEQANGQAKELGPLVDVYALGAILYECLTGRPPFRAATVVETLRQVTAEAPLNPRQLCNTLPRDLETICLKCLEKNPSLRYDSAAKLADDLRRFQEGSQIQARPAGPWTQGWRWCRKQTTPARVFLLTACLSVAMFWKFRTGQPPVPVYVGPAQMRTLTGESGREMCPAFSPDGKSVAYVWAGAVPDKQNADIYVRGFRESKAIRLTDDSAVDWCPNWSPDGNRIAFLRWRGKSTDIVTIASTGGEETLEAQFAARISELQWSPVDTDSFVYVVSAEREKPAQIQLWSRRSKQARDVAVGDNPDASFGSVRFSPDGSQLAFVSRPARFATEHAICITDVTGGSTAVVHRTNGVNQGLDWTSDGANLIFAFARSGRTTLWQVPASGGVPRSLLEGIDNVLQPVTSRDGQRLAFVKYLDEWDILRLNLHADATEKVPVPFLRSAGSQDSPALSRDGKRVAFTSDRSGIQAIYVAEMDRPDNPRLVADEGGADLGSPRWSPDGSRLAYDSTIAGQVSVRIVNVAANTKPTTLPIDNLDSAYLPDWGLDGNTLFVTSTQQGKEQIWQVPARGGTAVCITPDKGAMPRMAPDGEWLFYHRGPDSQAGGPEVRRLNLESGTDELVRELPGRPAGHGWNLWTTDGSAVYFLDLQSKPFGQLLRLPFRAQTSEVLVTFPQREFPHLRVGSYPGPRLEVDPHGQFLLFVGFRNCGSSIIIAENYR